MPSIRIIAAALVALCSSAQAQDWPTRPVTMVVPFAAGGAFDVMARIFAPQSQKIDVQIVEFLIFLTLGNIEFATDE